MIKLETLPSKFTTDNPKRTLPSANKYPSSYSDRGMITPSVLSSRDNLVEEVRKLKDLVKLQQKEIQRLTYINEYLFKANQQKLNILRDERQLTQGMASPMRSHQRLSRTQALATERKPMISKLLDEQPQLQQARRRTFRNPTMTRIQIESDSDLLKSDTNLRTANFYDVLQLEDCFRTNAILNLQLSDEDAIHSYNSDGTVSLMKELLESEEAFSEIITSISAQKLSFVFDKLKRIMTDHSSLFVLVLRLKKIVLGAMHMNSSVLLDDALNTIIDRCTECLECDRASCFIVDQTKKELWTRVAKGAQTTIRLQIGQGLAGYVASTHQILNIENAYLDQRFNSAMDQKQNYKTKTLLVCPIIDGDKCLGVLQCVNKHSTSSSAYFTKDDEALLQILSEFSRSVLKNALNHDAQILIQNKLRHLVKTAVLLQTKTNLQTTLFAAQERLRSLMNVDSSRVALYNNQKLMHLDKDGNVIESPPTEGIVGQCLIQKQTLTIGNCYAHPQFNPNIDIETNMPIICMPLKNDHDVIGVIQVINAKGIGNLHSSADSKINPVDQEMLDIYCQICAQSLFHFRSQ